jgi:hypothetical protein
MLIVLADVPPAGSATVVDVMDWLGSAVHGELAVLIPPDHFAIFVDAPSSK